ncbi:MAG TPA: hypothetical protein VFW07_04005 [Parafilimonas sp.]|nr:hypothetical protein [Parafilimonas sp.]
MKKSALLLRLNPNHWPVWQERLKEDSFKSIWFKTGRRIPSEIRKGIPVYVLGTRNLGLVAYGKTSSNVERIHDPDYKEAPPQKQEEYKLPENRVCADIKRISIPLAKISAYPALTELHTRRETTTWLDSEQASLLEELCVNKRS